MSSADEHTQQVSRLIERLLLDRAFRAEFRRDPAGACGDFGLSELAEELAESGNSMHTLELRESKSSLAGVVMAVAAEGIGVVELHGMIEHGLMKGDARAAGLRALRGVNPAHPAASLHSELSGKNPLRGAGHNPLGAAERSRELAGQAGQAPGGTAASPPSAAAGGGPGAPAQGAAAAGAPRSTPGVAAGAAPAYASPAGTGSAAAPPESTGWPVSSPPPGASGAAGIPPPGATQIPSGSPAPAAPVSAEPAPMPTPAGGGAQGAAPVPAPPSPGAQPAQGAAAAAWPESSQAPARPGAVPGVPQPGSAAPQASAGPAALLDSPRLEMPPDVRAILAQGNLDPRLVSVLGNAVAHHDIVVGDIQTSTEPVHAQAIDILSVDGQPVGPSNVAARDLVTEIAALEPGGRPSEIGTPWPIQSRGFFTDAQHEHRLHLAFTSTADYQPSPAGQPLAVGVPDTPSGGSVGAAGAPAARLASSGAPPSPQVPIAPSVQGSTGGGAAKALAVARSLIGKLPEIGGNNVGPGLNRFEASFGFHGAPWCGIFVGHVLQSSGLKVPDSIASVASILNMAETGNGPFQKGILPVSAIRPGDLVTFGGTEHVAIVTSVDAHGIHTIAGNTGQSNVSETTYSPGDVTGVVRPRYGPSTAGAQVMAAAPRTASAVGSPAGGADSPAALALPAASSPGSAPAAAIDISGAPPAPTGSPLKPDTAVFQAAQTHESSPLQHTVKFLQAVQPAAGSPPEGQASAAGAAQTPGAATPDALSASQPGGAADAAAGTLDAASGTISYPGDNAPKAQIAQWMADIAQKHGLPRELPVMAALVESSLHNDVGGDRDSVGYFQMRTGIWNNGPYAGYPNNPELQLKWFIDQAVAYKNQVLAHDPSFGSDPSHYGEWIADVERPAAEFRGRYQLRLDEARQLLGGS